ncbi:alpha/beta fold hydrolase [Spirosoma spitsbergense]|uniref:alpha/beta fold hydrolase n=1 Tax=Spirosoma spitsbergense TaxID=431554 RepID=UPI0003717E7B|nr:alpha/beta hydrolase [Spirosoma spitsbergense]
MKQRLTDRYNITITGNQDGQVILFAHGFGCDQGMWRYVAPAFEADYKVVLFDYIGHGRANLDAYNRERYASLHGYAQDVLDICHALDLQHVILVGHSVSSMIGTLACIREPDRFDRLIMVGPSPRYINDGDYYGGFEREDIEGLLAMMDGNFFGWATSLAPAIMGNEDRPQLGVELRESFCRTDLDVALQFARVTFYSDNRTDLPKLQTPSLVIQSLSDIIAPVEVGEYIAQKAPNSQLRVISATGHCPHLSAPAETTEVIHQYLASVN